jgi:LPS export ABC transporter protein LptC
MKEIFKKIVIISFAVYAVWWIFASETGMEMDDTSKNSSQEVVFKDFKLDNPLEKWTLEASRCYKNDKTQTTRFEEVKATNLNEDDTVTVITGKEGDLNEKLKKVEIKGDVKADQQSGSRKLFSDRVIYSYKMKVGSSPGKVKIIEDDSICWGNMMDFNVNTKTGKIVGNVKMRITELPKKKETKKNKADLSVGGNGLENENKNN